MKRKNSVFINFISKISFLAKLEKINDQNLFPRFNIDLISHYQFHSYFLGIPFQWIDTKRLRSKEIFKYRSKHMPVNKFMVKIL